MTMNKRVILLLLAVVSGLSVSAQTSADFERRYNQLVASVGYDGVGVETMLNNWEKVDSLNATLLNGRFLYCFLKSQSSEVVALDKKKYLGNEPVLVLKDTAGVDVYYHQVNSFDDELFGKAIKALDKGISIYPERLDFRFMKANAYMAYEKESPDMALADLLGLVEEARMRPWTYNGEKVEAEFIADAMLEYCYTFYTIATPASYDAFRALSEKMTVYWPEKLDFMNNLGSYELVVNNDCKAALKIYSKVLKKEPGNHTAILNSISACRKMNNVKKEKKYLQMLIEFGAEKDKLMAQGRLQALSK